MPNIHYERNNLTDAQLINLYDRILLPRMIEDKMLRLLRQGKVSKWFSGIGQEAISVGVTAALHPDEIIFPMHRNLAVFTGRDMPLERLFCQWQGKALGFSKGRERSFHFGSLEYGIVGMISHLGPQLALASGIALAEKIAKTGRISVAFSGEGGTSEGDFHEALNVASVWQLPVIFLIENNGYGLSTPTNEQYHCLRLADRGIGYGMEALEIDGNNIIEVFNTISGLAEDMRRNPRPVLVECRTFRMRGHEEASGTKYVPSELMEEWALKDPLENYQTFLLEEGIINQEYIETLRARFKQAIDKGLEIAFAQPDIVPNVADELKDVYVPFVQNVRHPIDNEPSNERRFVDAIADGLRLAMEEHNNLVLMGQDIAEYGGVFKITQGLVEAFGKERVRNTPLCESAILGIALGLSLRGYKSMVEMQFADFVTSGFNQIVNNLAKIHYRWGAKADVVIRMPTGGGVGAGPFHSQSNEAWFVHTPGLKVVYPSNPYDAKGLLLASFEDENPVMFFEHKALYRSAVASIPDGYYTVEIGKASIVREGTKASVITYGMGVHWAKKVIEKLGVDVEILDLRTLQPIDYESINKTIKKTNKVIILHEDTLIGGLGGELSAYISEHLFEHLDAPVMRCAGLDTPIPFAISLEQQFMPSARFEEQLLQLLLY